MKKIGMISLGCDKNRVDSEKVLYTLKQAGYAIVSDAQDADIIIINTCGFIDSAKKESINTILEFAGLKQKGDKKLVVIGCLAQRYASELAQQMPEIDLIVGIDSYRNIADILDEKFGRVVILPEPGFYQRGRTLTTPDHYAYLKIADGCNNFCSYCSIPLIRGRYRSYPQEEIIAEADALAQQGVKELILVAQDTTRYGKDLYGGYKLTELITKLTKLPFAQIRLLYAYPELIDDGLIELISGESKIAKYLDIPLQHIDDSVLQRMNRRSNSRQIYALLDKIKTKCPDIALRSSFIVGFPQETQEEFERLKGFIVGNYIDYAGFFAYSQEEQTAAAKMTGQISAKIKKQRETELSKIQSQNIVNTHAKYKDTVQKVIYEGIDYTKGCFVGRNQYNAPQIDTKVYFTSDFPLDIGEYYDVKITETGFHLKGKTIQ